MQPRLMTLTELYDEHFKASGIMTEKDFRHLLKANPKKSRIIQVGKITRCYEDSADFLFENAPERNPRLNKTPIADDSQVI